MQEEQHLAARVHRAQVQLGGALATRRNQHPPPQGGGNLRRPVVTAAIDRVSTLRGRLGAFQKNVVGATIRSLGVALENTSAAESSIRDTDFASETAALTRSQILVNAATNVLAIANSQPQSALALLG